MIVVCKTVIGKEYMRSKTHSILCGNDGTAKKLAQFLNDHNEASCGDFKLKDGETWHVYEIDQYDYQPTYKLKSMKGKISVVKI